MRGAMILSTGRYLPERVVDNRELEKIMDTSDEWITQRTGIKERRYVAKGETVSTMGAAAARKAMDKIGMGPDDVDCLVFATISPDYCFPGSGVLVQEELGLPCIGSMDVKTQCTGFVYGLSIAESFVKIGKYDHVLVIGAEVQSTGLDFSTEGRDISVIFGDGAGAAVVGPCEEGRGILSSHLHSEGKHAKELWCEVPGSSDNPRLTEDMLKENRHYPSMRGRFVFTHAVRRFQEVIDEALEANSLRRKDISLLIPHQANLRITQAVGKSMGLGEGQVYSNVQRYGNTTAASIPIALDESLEEGIIEDKDIVCLAAFGSGFTWGSVLLRW
jgi:3-oxoacyl-[acyl-carrier-protein] synthase-3